MYELCKLRQKYLDLEQGWDRLVHFTVSSFTITYKPHYYPHTIPGLCTSVFLLYDAAQTWQKR